MPTEAPARAQAQALGSPWQLAGSACLGPDLLTFACGVWRENFQERLGVQGTEGAEHPWRSEQWDTSQSHRPLRPGQHAMCGSLAQATQLWGWRVVGLSSVPGQPASSTRRDVSSGSMDALVWLRTPGRGTQVTHRAALSGPCSHQWWRLAGGEVRVM